jgi:hypothetical protein
VRWAESQRHGNAQAAAKLTIRQEQFPGRVDLGASSRCMVAKRDSRFGERSAARGSCEKLHAKFRFNASKLPTDDRLGDAEPTRSGRNAPGIGNFHECPERFDIQFGVPHSATQLATEGHYLIKPKNGNTPRDSAAVGACPIKKTNLTHNGTRGYIHDLS